VHLTVTAAVAPRVAEFGPDLADAVAAARATGPVALPPELRALATSLTPDALTPELVAGLAAGLGLGTGALDRMAAVNTLLDAAPARLRERLLVEFVGLLQRPAW
jgi:hypothetical protein